MTKKSRSSNLKKFGTIRKIFKSYSKLIYETGIENLYIRTYSTLNFFRKSWGNTTKFCKFVRWSAIFSGMAGQIDLKLSPHICTIAGCNMMGLYVEPIFGSKMADHFHFRRARFLNFSKFANLFGYNSGYCIDLILVLFCPDTCNILDCGNKFEKKSIMEDFGPKRGIIH